MSPDQSALLALQRATHATLHLLAHELADLDLTTSEINALANLADDTPRTVSQLATEVGARPSTLTSVLDRLERRGHISKGTLPATAARSSSNSPTPAAPPPPRSATPSPTSSTARSATCPLRRSPASTTCCAH